jgi:calcineurin-like phosphoesterase family protein
MIWFTADTHFGHANIIKYCNRPFSNVKEMDEEIINRWNVTIKSNDIVYHLGDFSMGDPRKYYSQLNGTVYIIPGSHDKDLKKLDSKFILLPLYTLKYNKELFILCHYALRTFYHSYYGTFQLYGHSHGKLPKRGRAMDVGVDTNNFYPYSIDKIKFELGKIPFGVELEEKI